MAADVLSNVCRSLRLAGGVYFRCQMAKPWGMDIAAQHDAMFHLVECGECWLRMATIDPPLAFVRGDLVVVFPGHRHALVDTPDGEALPMDSIVGTAGSSDYGPVVYGTGETQVEFLCGYFRFDPIRPHPLLGALPSLIHLRAADFSESAGFRSIARLILEETRSGRPGVEGVLHRLVEVLFMLVLRCYLKSARMPTGFLAALADKQVCKALNLLHARPGQAWTLAELAAQAGCSRSVLAARFRHLTDQTPMGYLTTLRMQEACELLATGRASTGSIAGQVGYRSESSFSKTFKKMVGIGPSAYRRHRDPVEQKPTNGLNEGTSTTLLPAAAVLHA